MSSRTSSRPRTSLRTPPLVINASFFDVPSHPVPIQAVVPIYFEHWEDNLQFYPNFALLSTLQGMKLNHYFFHEANQVNNRKKKDLHRKLSFCLRSQVKTKKSPKIIQRSDADHSQIIVGGDTVKLLGEYIHPSPPGFGTPAYKPCSYAEIWHQLKLAVV